MTVLELMMQVAAKENKRMLELCQCRWSNNRPSARGKAGGPSALEKRILAGCTGSLAGRHTAVALAEMVGCAPETVYAAAKEFGGLLKPMRSKIPDKRRNRVMELHAKHVTGREIAAKLKISASSVWKIISEETAAK